MSTNPSSLKLTNVTKVFGSGEKAVTAADSINLDINPGEFITFLGPSGCGKTTTLRMIAGFENPTAGTIQLDGVDLADSTPDKRPMGMVFQSYALFPHMTVFENVAYGLRIKKLKSDEIKRRVGAVLESMSLTNLADRAPNQMSGGQQQRVALARAMVMEPKVLLFDEPLSNLDAKLRAQMRIEIRHVQRRLGITSIFVTHDQDEAMSISDRIVVMRNAKIEQIGTPDEIYRHPKSIFVADFIGRSNFFDVDSVEEQGNGNAKISLLGQSLTVASGAQGASKTQLLVRPESIKVSSHEGFMKATVEDVVFYGEHVEYELSFNGKRIVAVVSDPVYSDIVKVGSTAMLSFDASRAWLLPSDN